ncbi:hypothetical protein MBLNU230_g6616t1 [Neophaeotheca triangularis]
MAFARAFSTRGKKPEPEISNPMRIGRAATQRGGKPVFRHEISSPVALLSTTNATAHNHADIPGTSPIEYCNQPSYPSSAASSHSSGEDSDASSGSVHSNDTITDASSVDESPCEPNHLSCYFKPAVETNRPTSSHSPTASARPSFDSSRPNLPQRAPSHSKKAHEMVSRQRSISRMQSPPGSRGRTSIEAFSPTRSGFVEAPRESPFDNELAQLDEVAEEYGQVISNHSNDEDTVYMQSLGLAHFGASDYMAEISSVMDYLFAEDNDTAGWI